MTTPEDNTTPAYPRDFIKKATVVFGSIATSGTPLHGKEVAPHPAGENIPAERYMWRDGKNKKVE